MSYPEKSFDVSEFQGRVDWRKVHEDGFRHAFAKASEGEAEIDVQIERNASHARANGVKLSLYHFARPELGAKRNAHHFLRVALPLVRVGDPVPVLDLEVSGGLDWYQLWHWQHEWGSIVGEALGCTTMLYSSASWLASIPFPKHPRPIWGASWGHASRFELDRWHAWQYSAVGRIAGIAATVDLDSILKPLPTIGRKP